MIPVVLSSAFVPYRRLLPHTNGPVKSVDLAEVRYDVVYDSGYCSAACVYVPIQP
jgi:hypothetical protein